MTLDSFIYLRNMESFSEHFEMNKYSRGDQIQ